MRSALTAKIENIIKKNKSERAIVFDIHAGIGERAKLQFIYHTSRKKVKPEGPYLVDGLARDIRLAYSDCYVIEAGISSTNSFFSMVLSELLNRHENASKVFKRDKLMDELAFNRWKDQIRYNFKKCFSESLLETINTVQRS